MRLVECMTVEEKKKGKREKASNPFFQTSTGRTQTKNNQTKQQASQQVSSGRRAITARQGMAKKAALNIQSNENLTTNRANSVAPKNTVPIKKDNR